MRSIFQSVPCVTYDSFPMSHMGEYVGNREQCLKFFSVSLLLFCHDRKCLQSINFPECTLCSEVSRFFSSWLRNPARGRVVVDALVIPGLYLFVD